MRQLLSRRGLPAAVLATLLLPAGAGAATYCAPAPCGDDPAHAFATVRAAVEAAGAAAGADEVAIGAGTFDLGEGVTVFAADTSVHGAGRGATILTTAAVHGDAGGSTIIAGQFARLSDLTVRLPSVVTNGPAKVTGVFSHGGGVVERVRVDAEGATFGPGANDGEGAGLDLRNGSARDVEVAFDPASDTLGANLGGIGGSVALEDVTVTAGGGIVSSPQTAVAGVPVPVTAHRLRVTAVRPLAIVDGSFTLSDALVRTLAGAAGDDPAGIALYSGRAPSPAALTLDRVTLVGSGQAGSAALEIGGGAGPTPTRLTARHLVATGFPATLRQNSWGGDLETTISHSVADTSAAAILDETDPSESASRTVDVATGNHGGDPRFADPLGGDYSLRTGSPAIDVGGADLVAGDATDLAGGPRPLDGDGDGVLANDAGAFEASTWQPPAGCRDSCPPPLPPEPPEPPRPQPPRCKCGPPPDHDAPKLSSVTLSSARLLQQARRAASLRFLLSEEAVVRVSIERRHVLGRGRGARARWVAVGALKPLRLAAGRRSIALRARLGRRALSAGAYRAVLVATDAAGNRSAARRVGFSVARATSRGPARRR